MRENANHMNKGRGVLAFSSLFLHYPRRERDLMPGITSGRKILIVDDEETIADTLTLIFSSNGYEARTAYSAEQALEVLEEWRPDLAVIDVVLPGMNGIEFAIFLKASYPGCHFLLFSGQPGTSGLLEEAKKKGHLFEILAKPLHPTFMLATVSDMLTAPNGEQPSSYQH
jgi:DNA-binding NtrC family response regulator